MAATVETEVDFLTCHSSPLHFLGPCNRRVCCTGLWKFFQRDKPTTKTFAAKMIEALLLYATLFHTRASRTSQCMLLLLLPILARKGCLHWKNKSGDVVEYFDRKHRVVRQRKSAKLRTKSKLLLKGLWEHYKMSFHLLVNQNNCIMS